MVLIEGFCQKLSEYYDQTGNGRLIDDRVEFPEGRPIQRGAEGKCMTTWCPLAIGQLALCNMKAEYLSL